ncbi:MAG: Gfo/Idh/MocA family oxidoreductase [Planctomycetes bacterium]|nr:Gfo/Idh/MocA family oxidoreductase [Planctomycetota bacterium]
MASSSQVTRRCFLQQTSVMGTALGVSTLTARRALGANERLAIGMIGVGGRGSAHMAKLRSLAQSHNVEITAVCDVWQVNLKRAAERGKGWFGREPKQFTRFGDLLTSGGVDAVVIATPDFSHTPILIAALKADKDAYVEKPMSITIEEANEALDVARARKRVVQVGTQYRSNGGFIAASKELATGVLGQINRISAQANFNQPRWARAYSDCKQKDVDWDAYLFNRSKRPFDARLLRRWHLYREFTNGLSGLWMSHYVDAVHLLTGAKYPRSAVAHGNIYVWKDGREHTDTFHALLDYPEGFLFDWGMGLGNSAGVFFAVYGTQGTLDIGNQYLTPNKLLLSPEGGSKGSKGSEEEDRTGTEP